VIIVNFAHPITPAQCETIAQLAGEAVERIVDVPIQFDPAAPFVPQVREAVESAGLTAAQWQTERLVINPPSLASIATLIIAELHGRMGYFPTVVRLRPVPDRTPPQFEVAELINLQAVRDAARQIRNRC
jgi:hypothetical protein